jgi:hypothetical protein
MLELAILARSKLEGKGLRREVEGHPIYLLPFGNGYQVCGRIRPFLLQQDWYVKVTGSLFFSSISTA